MHTRTDLFTEVHVYLAINVAASNGVAAGARELFRLGLPLELARRVLLRPAERRRGGWREVQPDQPRTAEAAPAPAR